MVMRALRLSGLFKKKRWSRKGGGLDRDVSGDKLAAAGLGVSLSDWSGTKTRAS